MVSYQIWNNRIFLNPEAKMISIKIFSYSLHCSFVRSDILCNISFNLVIAKIKAKTASFKTL